MDGCMYKNFTEVLKHELVPALGCTEPIAIAFAAATARKHLGCTPEKAKVLCSGNIVKNVKSVTVPCTNGMTGIAASALAGAIGGDASRNYEVLESMTEEHILQVQKLLDQGACEVGLLEGDAVLDIIVTLWAGEDTVTAEVKDEHVHIALIEKNGEVLFKDEAGAAGENKEIAIDPSAVIADVLEYANTVDLDDVREVLSRQLKLNLQIAEEGLRNPYGANVGKTILKCKGTDVEHKAVAYPAAGSDARMNGCALPVVINSGSGNQGMTASLPVYIFAKEYNIDEEKMYRALVFSNLAAIYQKSRLGKLSAYCGAVSAGIGSGAAITYMLGGTLKQIEDTITNAIGTLSGIVCDGAKASCAAKIASSVEGAILAHHLAMNGDVFQPGEGLVMNTLQETVEAYTTMGRVGMHETDKVILRMMTC